MKRIICFVIVLILSSCGLTERMLERPQYREEIRQFSLTEDGKNILAVGKKYHYVFQVNNNLNNILNWKYKNLLTPKFGKFSIEDDNEGINGRYRLIVKKEQLPTSEHDWLLRNGFQDKKFDGFVYNDTILGRRYEKKQEIKLYNEYKEPYILYISENPSVISKTLKITATPITLAADGTAGMLGVAGIASAVLIWCVTNSCSSK